MKLEEFNNMIGKEVLSKHSMSYILGSVRGKFALIEVRGSKGMARGFEVWKLRERGDNSLAPGHLWFPSDEEFGRYGWFFPDLETAQKRYEELVNGI